ncbi:phosphoribosyltransferase family protein [Spirillospora sp. CA-253888]
MTGRTVVLADDVLTSGHTLAEATRALGEAGADVSAAATLAVTLRRPRA